VAAFTTMSAMFRARRNEFPKRRFTGSWRNASTPSPNRIQLLVLEEASLLTVVWWKISNIAFEMIPAVTNAGLFNEN
jgi:hypothetical protein